MTEQTQRKYEYSQDEEDRQSLRNVLVAASGKTQILYTGESLNQDDLDLFMHLVGLASIRPSRKKVGVYIDNILTELKKPTGNNQHEQIWRGIIRLCKGNYRIKSPEYKYYGSLIDGVEYYEKSPLLVYSVSRPILQFYAKGNYSKLSVRTLFHRQDNTWQGEGMEEQKAMSKTKGRHAAREKTLISGEAGAELCRAVESTLREFFGPLFQQLQQPAPRPVTHTAEIIPFPKPKK